MTVPSVRQLEHTVAGWGVGSEVAAYFEFHKHRYGRLLALVAAAAGDPEASVDVLDIGTFLQTQLLRDLLPQARVHTIREPSAPAGGWGRPRDGERHLAFDLNLAQDRAAWLDPRPHDIVVMAEVLEHLHTSPRHVLAFVASLLRPGGHLVLQTPNAARLDARLSLLRGRHPYEMIRDSRENPGHFREYTRGELERLLPEASLSIVEFTAASYFRHASPARRALSLVSGALPPSLREGFSLLASRNG